MPPYRLRFWNPPGILPNIQLMAVSSRACLLTVYGFETLVGRYGNKGVVSISRACLLTVYGFETYRNTDRNVSGNIRKSCMPPYRLRFWNIFAIVSKHLLSGGVVVHASLPFTVLKLVCWVFIVIPPYLTVVHASLPFTVLKHLFLVVLLRYTMRTSRACLLTVYGFETYHLLVMEGPLWW